MSQLSMSCISLLVLIVLVCMIFGYLAGAKRGPRPQRPVRMKGVKLNPLFDRDWKSR